MCRIPAAIRHSASMSAPRPSNFSTRAPPPASHRAQHNRLHHSVACSRGSRTISPEATGGPAKMQYDYVIVGGGSAGCVLANRLSARSNTTVALIEAGVDTPPDHTDGVLWDSYPIIA